MAWTEVTTVIANPAGKRGSMTAKQIKFFGSKRQKAALKRKNSAKRKRMSSHRKRSNPSPKRRRASAAPKRRRKTVHRARARKRTRKNPGEIISLALGNPAKRRKKAVAKTRRKKASVRRHAGRRHARRRSNPGVRRHHRRRSNPGFAGFNGADLLSLGGGAVIGGSIPSFLSQIVLGAKNTGWMGYLANLVATFLTAWGVGRFAKGKSGSMLTMGIVAGGVGSTIKRIITDYSILGSYGQQLGFGDYMVSNWVTPQRMVDGLNSAMVEIPNGWAPTTVVAAPAGGMGRIGMGSAAYNGGDSAY